VGSWLLVMVLLVERMLLLVMMLLQAMMLMLTAAYTVSPFFTSKATSCLSWLQPCLQQFRMMSLPPYCPSAAQHYSHWFNSLSCCHQADIEWKWG
jgi:hypothetical protein